MWKTKNNFEYVAYIVIGLLLVLLALLGDFSLDAIFVMNSPFDGIGTMIRTMAETNPPLKVVAYIVYIIICLLPIVYPLVRIIKSRRFDIRYIIFMLITVYLFFMIYFFINPQLIRSFFNTFPSISISDINESFTRLTKLGMVITLFLFIILAVLLEFRALVRRTSERVFLLSRILVFIFVIGIMFSSLYLDVFTTKTALANLDIEEFGGVDISINKPINVFYILMQLFLRLLANGSIIVLLVLVGRFISSLNKGLFDKCNISKLKKIEIVAEIALVITIATQIIINLLGMMLSDKILNVSYETNIPYLLILADCLLIIFTKIFVKAIELNEENKLVI